MTEYYTMPVLWVDLLLNILSILLGLLTIYCYIQLQVLRKPPGSIILIHICIVLYLQIIEILEVITG